MNIVVVAYNSKLKAYVVRYGSGPIGAYMEGRSREVKLGEFASHSRAMSFAREVAADAGGIEVYDLSAGRNRAGSGTRASMRNEYGMTYLEWLYAAGYDLGSARGNAHVLEAAWRAGEDPSDYRASRNRSGVYRGARNMAAKKRATKRTSKKSSKKTAKRGTKKSSKRGTRRNKAG